MLFRGLALSYLAVGGALAASTSSVMTAYVWLADIVQSAGETWDGSVIHADASRTTYALSYSGSSTNTVSRCGASSYGIGVLDLLETCQIFMHRRTHRNAQNPSITSTANHILPSQPTVTMGPAYAAATTTYTTTDATSASLAITVALSESCTFIGTTAAACTETLLATGKGYSYSTATTSTTTMMPLSYWVVRITAGQANLPTSAATTVSSVGFLKGEPQSFNLC